MSNRIVGQGADELRLLRLRGDHGTVLRCSGVLCSGTAEALRWELQMLMSLEQPVLTVNLIGCREVDADGLLALFDAHRKILAAGRQLILVSADWKLDHFWRAQDLDRHIPLFPSETAASRALQAWGVTAPEGDAHGKDADADRNQGRFLNWVQEAVSRGEWQLARRVVGEALQSPDAEVSSLFGVTPELKADEEATQTIDDGAMADDRRC